MVSVWTAHLKMYSSCATAAMCYTICWKALYKGELIICLGSNVAIYITMNACYYKSQGRYRTITGEMYLITLSNT